MLYFLVASLGSQTKSAIETTPYSSFFSLELYRLLFREQRRWWLNRLLMDLVLVLLTWLLLWLDNPVLYLPQKERISRTMREAFLPFEAIKVMQLESYFILNGLERVIRLLILPKRNYPMSLVRNSFSDRREGYTDKAVVIRFCILMVRCVRADQSSLSVKLYYLRNGSASLGFWLRGREYLLPVGIVLKALIDTTDREIYVNMTSCYNENYEKGKGAVGTQLVGERAKIILDELRDLSLLTRLQCLEYIGEHFQPIMTELKNDSYPIVADTVLKDCILVHLDSNFDKFNLLIFMLQKLFSLIDQASVPDNPDSLQNHEVLLPGHLITLYLKEKLEDWLQKGRRLLLDEIDKKSKKFDFRDIVQVKKVMDKNSPKQVSTAVENMLKTGRLVTQTGLDLQQRAGYTVQAERLNFLRFLSHFRAVHRGASFAGLCTTTVRKLLPELILGFSLPCPHPRWRALRIVESHDSY
ncbi:hypothetical protein VNO78_19914 [Psophocarpus tetragonolobus]|uniref:DNA-directed RNA polymerase n=1 Tax=Psophocarpus tetragonolobus TaxID=3891 RepID=A0AAN9S8G9_PSOTE